MPERIIADVLAADPTAPATRQAPVTLLTALQLTLSQLWERRQDGRLTHYAYDQIGGVTGSLTTWCNTALNQLPAEDRPTAQRILTALVRPPDDTHSIPATRQHVDLTDLRALASDPLIASEYADQAFDTVLAALTRRRIITTRTTPKPDGTPGHATAELIHDALIRDWNDLRDWVAADHHFHAWLNRVGERHTRFTESGNLGDLLNGTDLTEGITWSQQRGLPPEIARFLSASHQRQQTTVRRTRRINTALACMLALSLIASGIAFWQRQNAITEQQRAFTAQRMAQSRQLATQSAALLNTDPYLASLLAVQAYRTSRTREATANLYTAAALPLRHVLTDHTAQVTSVAFSPDGRTLATASADKTVRLWDAATGKTRRRLSGHTAFVTSVAFNPDGRTLATASADKTVRLWDAATGRVRLTLTNRNDMNSVAFSPDGRSLAIAGNQAVWLWDVATGRARLTLTNRNLLVESVSFSPDGRSLAIGDDTTVRLWDVDTGKIRHTLASDFSEVGSIAFSPDGRTLATGDRATVRLWDARTGKARRTLIPNTEGATAVTFSPDGGSLATGGHEESVRLWDVATGETREVLTGHADRVYSLTFSPDGRTLASASQDKTVRLWDVATGKAGRTFSDHPEPATSVAFSPDGRSLATSHDTTVQFWDLAAGKARGIHADGDLRVSSVAFSPDGRTIAMGGKTVRLWHVNTGQTDVIPVSYWVGSLAFSPDGRTLASASSDKIVRLWDAKDGIPRDGFTGHTGPVNLVGFSPDGNSLATGGRDETLRIWALYLPDPADAMSMICQALHRDFTREERSMYVKDQEPSPVCPA